MKTNVDSTEFDVIEITNEMPLNRIGGVGSVVENLITGFEYIGLNALWFLVDHNYRDFEIEQILKKYRSVVVGSYEDLIKYSSPVVHIHSYSYSPQLLQYLKNKHTIFTIHSLLAYEEISNDISIPQAIKLQELLIGSCDKIVLISQAEYHYYQKLGYNNLNPNVSVIYNGVKKPAHFSTHRNNKKIGFCGRLVPRKHPEYVQMLLTEKEFEDYEVFIAGKGFSTYARDLVQFLKIEDRVQYLGWCGGSRLEAFYKNIDVLVVPSVYEPFGMSALEAAARGIPVVCTNVDGLAEIFRQYAIYCEGNTYEQFLDAMVRWLNSDEKELIEMTTAFKARYEQHFTDHCMARNYRKIFHQQVSRG
jgi:glycosyltransferase involved in cell wall biosynthesis